MGHFEPYGCNDKGEAIFAYRLTEADVADILMASLMHDGSPDGQAERAAFLASLADGSITIDFDRNAADEP